MGKYLLKRIGLMLLTFIITVFLFFVFIKLLPDKYIPTPGKDDTWYEAMKKQEGWDKPIPEQFFLWVKNIFTLGTFGFSKYYREDVSKFYFRRIPPTIQINIIPYFLSIPLAIGIGILAALHKNKFIDNLISVLIVIFISVPFFVVVLFSQYLFYYKLHWIPSPQVAPPSEFISKGTIYGLSTYIFPIIILTITSIPGFARAVRAELTEQLTQDYMLLARSKGLTKSQATFRHALKNSLVPFLPGIFLGVIGVINGGIITERMFGVAGTGEIYLKAFNDIDIALLMFINAFGQFIGLISGIVGDVSYTLFDPRVRVGSGKLS